MKTLLVVAALSLGLWASALPARAQVTLNPDFRVFDKNGQPASLMQITDKAQTVDVLFLGEEHDNAIGHALEAEIFKAVITRTKASRPVALLMEMFERDTQTVLDEYLADLITEKQLLSDARPWPNYASDYQPLVTLAKTNRLPVIAANAPRRYTNMVSRGGRSALNALSTGAKSWLAPLPYPLASAAYAQKFNAMMAGIHDTKFLDAQTLWDATMADSIRQQLDARKNALVVHISGKFHSESNLGTVECLKGYRPATRTCVVTLLSAPTFPRFDPAQKGLADFIILTAPPAKPSDEAK